jgi:hypothetical protein
VELDGLSGILALAEGREFRVRQEIRSGPLKGVITNLFRLGLIP